MTVYSKNVDPRFGEQTYRLTNINRSDPPMTLFAPRADYQIVEDGRFPAKPGFVHALPKVPPAVQKPPPPPKPAVERETLDDASRMPATNEPSQR